MKAKSILYALILLLSFTGCAGRKFTRIPEEQLGLGSETTESIQAKLGKPFEKSKLVRNGKMLQAFSYSHAKPSFAAPALKTQAFYFHDNKLVGHFYTSTRQEDRTDFDASKVEQIKEGKTTIEEAMKILGPPGGEYIYPMIPEQNEKAKVYFYFQAKPGFAKPKLFYQVLRLHYDTGGLVKKVEYEELGEK